MKYLPVLLLACLLPVLSLAQSLEPPKGAFLHGVYPGGKTGQEDDITPADVDAYEQAAGQKVSWVYFSNNWYSDRRFPQKTARWIRARGAVPFIRLMLRSDDEQDHAEPLFTPAAIAAGRFDRDLARWGQAAAKFATPLLVEYGTEVNGQWFGWNGIWNGRAQGAADFRAAYRHIIDVMRANGADNITWVFHVSAEDDPQESWNRMENYYPGDDYIDWLAVSVYSLQSPQENGRTDFRRTMDRVMRRFRAMAPDKPVIVAEFGTDIHNRHENAARWAGRALADMLSGRWPALIGFSWWNERWENDGIAAHDTDMRVQDDPALAQVFRDALR